MLDCTAGNGYDSLEMAKIVALGDGVGKLYVMDVQASTQADWMFAARSYSRVRIRFKGTGFAYRCGKMARHHPKEALRTRRVPTVGILKDLRALGRDSKARHTVVNDHVSHPRKKNICRAYVLLY